MLTGPQAHAQDDENDFLDMSLQSLMEVEGMPIDVLTTHIHPKGEWMIRYQFMTMPMEGNRVGADSVSTENVLQGYKVSPTRMTMQMHMVDVMYGWTDDLTLMVMMPFVQSSMDHVTRGGSSFTTDASGLGDVSLMAHYNMALHGPHRVVFLGGLSMPTGSIDAVDDTPAGEQSLPYPMQLGSGTFDLKQGISYIGQTRNWAWGADAKGTFRLGENSQQYSLGNRFHSSVWATRRLYSWSALSLQLASERWGDVAGADPRLNPAMVPTADPDLRGGWRLDTRVELSFFIPSGSFQNQRFFIDAVLPAYQNLHGPQLESSHVVHLGWEWRF